MSKFFKKIKHPIKKLSERNYDVVFLGNVNYGDSYLSTHRLEILNKIKEIGEKHKLKYIAAEKININQYYEVLKETKIFVSPYGYGEWSLKDYECIQYGCHIIKPNIFYESYPKYYENMSHFNDNINNLEHLILDLLNNIELIQDKVNKNRQLYLEYTLQNNIIELEKHIMDKISK